MLFWRRKPKPAMAPAQGGAQDLSGAVMISNSMILESARVLNEHGAPPLEEGYAPYGTFRGYLRPQVSGLLTLIDALVIHDSIVTLPATLPADADALPFRTRLIREGILTTLHPGDKTKAVGEIIFREMKRAASAEGGAKKWPEEEMRQFLGLRQATRPRAAKVDDAVDQYRGGRWSDAAIEARSPEELYVNLVRGVEYAASGAYESNTSLIRTLFYIAMSEEYEVPFHPERNRVRMYREFPSYLDNQARIRIYESMARSLSSTLEKVNEDFGMRSVQMPPFAALALSRAGSVERLSEEIFALRDEYAKLRAEFRALEQAVHAAGSLDERLALKRRLDTLLADSSRVFDEPSAVQIEQVLRYIPKIAKAVVDKTELAKLVIELVAKGGEEFHIWWRRRPISLLFSAASHVKRAPAFGVLLRDMFGEGGVA